MGANLKRLSIRHDEILEWLILNPERTHGECAIYFNLTQAWLSMIIHSDLFQAKLADIQEQGREVGIYSIKEKMAATASMALDQIMEKIPLTTDLDDLNKVAKTTLNSLGYGGRDVETPSGMQQNNFFMASPEAMAEARNLLNKVHQTTAMPDMAGGNPRNVNAILGEAIEVEDNVNSAEGSDS